MKIQTPFTDLLDIQYPIIAAPMFLVSYEEIVIAVSNAGGLGMFPTPNYRTLEDLEHALKTIRAATGKPIGVNIHLHGRFPWKEQLALCLNAGVSFFISSLGNPALIVDDVHANGGIVYADVTSLGHGLKARDRGADGLVAVAAGAGGHCGKIPTLILVPYLREKTGLPIIASGGISSGAQMAAAIAVGACAVIVGTRLIASAESRAGQEYKEAVVAARPEDIVVSDKISGYPATWLASTLAGFDPQAEAPDVKRWRDVWSAGLSVAQTDSIKPAAEIIREMVDDYARTCKDMLKTLPGEHR